MKYFIHIDKETIKKNPNVGNMVSFEPGPVAVSLTAYNVDNKILDDDRVLILEYRATPEIIEMLSALITDHSFLDDIEKYTKEYSIEYNRDIIRYSHLPEPEYFYSYQSVKVTCTACGSTFSSDELQSDSIYNGEDEFFSFSVCPICGAFDCCDIEYETISEALKEANL